MDVSEGRAETGALDPIDVRVSATGAAPARPARSRPVARLSPDGMSGPLLVSAGVALGPLGVGVLSPAVLSSLEPAVPVALAALGVLIGVGIDVRGPGARRILAGSVAEAVLTAVVVGAGIWLAFDRTAGQAWLPIALGVCASTSSSVLAAGHAGRSLMGRVADLDALPAIVSGGLVLALSRLPGAAAAGSMTAQIGFIVLLIAGAGWMLIRRASTDGEQRVFTVAILLLIGGVAGYLSFSALLIGLMAGVFWTVAGGAPHERIGRDLRHIQRPLLVFLLIVAGAGVALSAAVMRLVVLYVLLRIVGKLAGGILARRIVTTDPAARGHELISPGLVGVALALDAARATGSEAVLSVAVIGALGSELVATFARPREADR